MKAPDMWTRGFNRAWMIFLILGVWLPGARGAFRYPDEVATPGGGS
jgi:hypothetical protein